MFRWTHKGKLLTFLVHYRKLAYVYLLVITIVMGFLLNRIVFRIDGEAVPAFAGGEFNSTSQARQISNLNIWFNRYVFDVDNCQKILEQGVPGLLHYSQQRSTNTGSRRGLAESVLFTVTNIDFNNPYTFFHNQIPLAAKLDYPTLARYHERDIGYTPGLEIVPDDDHNGDVPLPQPNNDKVLPSPQFDGKVTVGIYHSHNSETFVDTPGTRGDHHLEGQNAEIVTVGKELTRYLYEQHGIGVVHSTVIHDYPVLRQAYQKSVVTAQQMLKDNDSIRLLLDVHRDAQARQLTTTEINGKTTAKILILVGTDRLGLHHPHWEKNYDLAKTIVAKMEEKYPGLSRGILVADGRYNQHLSPGALLIEIGAHENTKEEALRGARLFGDVLAAVLAEM